MAYADLPPTIHLTVTAAVSATADEFEADLAAAVAAARARGPVRMPPALVQTVGALTAAMVTPQLIEELAAALGLGGGDFREMAAVNTMLNVAPARLREALLTGFLSLLQRPGAVPVGESGGGPVPGHPAETR
jgi:hypothetical protein